MILGTIPIMGVCNMKKGFVILITIFIILLMSCSSVENIKIGFIATLSGNNSGVGIAIRDGLLLKVDQINDAGGINGRKIEVIIKDDQGDKTSIVQLDQELIASGVSVIFGHELSSKAEFMVEAAKDYEVIFMTPTISSDTISNIDDNIFRTTATAYDQGETLGEHADGYSKKILVIYSEYNKAYADGFTSGFDASFDGELDFFSVNNDVTKKANDIVSTYEDGNFDSLLFITNSQDMMFVSQVFYSMKVNVKKYSSNWAMASDSFADGGESVEGSSFVSIFNSSESDLLKAFNKEFMSRYNKEPDFASKYSYEAACMLFAALEDVEDLDFSEIKEALLKTEIEGLFSSLSFNEFGDVKRESLILKVINGVLVEEK